MRLICVAGFYVVLLVLSVIAASVPVGAEKPLPQHHWFDSINVGSTYYVMSAKSVVADGEGFLYVVGETRAFGEVSDVFVAKMNSSDGSIVWVKSIGGGGGEEGSDIVLYGNDTLYVVGSTTSYGEGDFDILLAKINAANGSLEWLLTIGTSNREKAYALTMDDEGKIYVSGCCEGLSTTACVMKINPENRSLEWFKLYGGSNYDSGFDIEYHNGVVYVVGETIAFYGYYDVYVLAANSSNGSYLWSLAFGSSGRDNSESGRTIAVVNNSLYVAGMYPGKTFLAKINSTSQEIEWIKTYYSSDYSKMGMYYAGKEDLVLTSLTTEPEGAGGADAAVADVYPDNGSIKWIRFLGGSNRDRSYGVTVSHSGYVYVVGETKSFSITIDSAKATHAFVSLVSENISDTLTWLNTTGWSPVQVTAPNITATSITPFIHEHHKSVNTADPVIAVQPVVANTISRSLYVAVDENVPIPISEPPVAILVAALALFLIMVRSVLRR